MSCMEYRSVAIYARVSTDNEAQLSALENQIQYYDNILAAHPEWKLYDRYIDEGITATSIKKRKNFIRMMQDAEEGKFDLIITREVSRFARNTVDALQETRKLKRKGIDVWFTDDNIRTLNDEDGELRLTIMATLAQNESKKTSMRTKAGQMVSFQNAVPYGTSKVLGYERAGKQLVINPEQAETVRIIYRLYLEGKGEREIQLELEQMGRLTSMGCKRWSTASISRVLNNPLYSGTLVYRNHYVPDYLEQKIVRNNGEVEKIVVEGKHEPIISKEDFARVQEKLNERKARRQGKQYGTKDVADVWGKKLVCSCGSRYNRRIWNKGNNKGNNKLFAYQCYNQIQYGSINARKKKGLSIEGCCDVSMVAGWKLNCMVSYIFKNFWKDKKKILFIANDLLEKGYDGEPEQDKRLEEIRQLKEQLLSIDKKMDKLVDLRLNDVIDLEKYSYKRQELLDLQDKVKKKLEDLGGAETQDDTNLEKKLSLLKLALDKKFDFDEYTLPESVIDAFVEKVVVHKDKYEWHLTLWDDDKVIYSNSEGKVNNNTVNVWEESLSCDGSTNHIRLTKVNL